MSFVTHRLLIFILGSALKNRKLKPVEDICVSRQDTEGKGVDTAQSSQRRSGWKRRLNCLQTIVDFPVEKIHTIVLGTGHISVAEE